MAGHFRRRVAACVIGALALPVTALASADAAPTAAPKYDSAIAQESRITTRYGDTMAIQLCFPATKGVRAPGRFPVVAGLIYTGRAGASPCASQMPYINAGYVYAEIQVPGSAGSEGGPWNYSDTSWALRNYDAIEWVAKQPWSTGKIGTIGGSGNGVSQLWTSQHHPPHLTTMIPQVSSHDGYDMQFPGGMRSLALATLLCSIPGTLTTAQNGMYAPPQNQDQIDAMVRIQRDKALNLQGNPYCPPTYGSWQHPNHDAFWDDLNSSHIETVKIPVWVQGSWDDLFVNASQHDYLTFGSPNKMFSMGYVSHAGASPGFDAVAQSIRWFDYWLKGIDNGIVADLKNGRFQYQSWQEWKPKQAANYPIPGTKYTPFYLGTGSPDPLATGSLGTTAPKTAGSDTYVYDPASGAVAGGPYAGFARTHNQSNPANRDTVAYLDPGGRGDQRLDPAGRVVYLGDPLKSDMEVTGPITATIYASTTAADTDFVVKLLDVDPNEQASTTEAPPGYWHLVQPGYLKGTFRSYKSGYVKQTPIPVGEVVRYEVEVWPTSWYFRKGHRIGITISSSDALAAGPNANPAQVTIHHSAQYPSAITLPVIPKSATRYVTDQYMHTGKATAPTNASTSPLAAVGAPGAAAATKPATAPASKAKGASAARGSTATATGATDHALGTELTSTRKPARGPATVWALAVLTLVAGGGSVLRRRAVLRRR
jgi:putative CocE/NonD family hydrolase